MSFSTKKHRPVENGTVFFIAGLAFGRVFSAELGAGGDGVVHHQQVELFLAVLGVDGGDQHAVGLQAHHLPGRQVHDGHQRLADEVLRLVELVDAGEDLPVGAGAVVQDKLEELFALLHSLAGLHLHHSEVGLAEGIEVHLLGELGLHLHGGQRGLPGRGLQLLQLCEGLLRVDAGEEVLPLGDGGVLRQAAPGGGAVPGADVGAGADLGEELVAALGRMPQIRVVSSRL